jgi:DNA-binding NtrC family response regulator
MSLTFTFPDLKISDAVFSILSINEWKGNIRELRNALEHAVALADHDTILSEDLPASININHKQNDRGYTRNYDNLQFSTAKDIFEKTYIENLMNKCQGDVTKASKISDIKRQNLYEKFKKYNLDPNSFRINK